MGRHSIDENRLFRQSRAQGVEQHVGVVEHPRSERSDPIGIDDWLPGWEREEADPASTPAAKHAKIRRRPSVFQMLIGFIGELLITAGVVIGLFIVWQVWWTDILAGKEQSDRIASVEQNWGKAPTTKIGAPQAGDPPPVEHVNTVGGVEGIMYIPRFGKDYQHSIEYGTSLAKVLDKGAFGHYENTAYPGEVGNFATAAHRQTYGAAMRNVDELKAGDPIVVATKDAYFVYYVYDSYVVDPGKVEVVSPVPGDPGGQPTERLLTITTCHPPFVSDKRWIIHAKYDHWVARSDGIPAELDQK